MKTFPIPNFSVFLDWNGNAPNISMYLELDNVSTLLIEENHWIFLRTISLTSKWYAEYTFLEINWMHPFLHLFRIFNDFLEFIPLKHHYISKKNQIAEIESSRGKLLIRNWKTEIDWKVLKMIEKYWNFSVNLTHMFVRNCFIQIYYMNWKSETEICESVQFLFNPLQSYWNNKFLVQIITCIETDWKGFKSKFMRIN